MINPLPNGINEVENISLSNLISYTKYVMNIIAKSGQCAIYPNVKDTHSSMAGGVISSMNSAGIASSISADSTQIQQHISNNQVNNSTSSSPSFASSTMISTESDSASAAASSSSVIILDKQNSAVVSTKDKNKKDFEYIKKCTNRISRFKHDILGSSSIASNKLPVVVSDLSFMKIRELNSIIYKICDVNYHANTQDSGGSNELLTFIQNNNENRKGIRLIINELLTLNRDKKNDNIGTSYYVLIYSSTDDKYDMLAYIPGCIDKHMNLNNRHASPGSSGHNVNILANAASTTHAPTSGKYKSSRR
jgi:hypothetical protein